MQYYKVLSLMMIWLSKPVQLIHEPTPAAAGYEQSVESSLGFNQLQ